MTHASNEHRGSTRWRKSGFRVPTKRKNVIRQTSPSRSLVLCCCWLPSGPLNGAKSPFPPKIKFSKKIFDFVFNLFMITNSIVISLEKVTDSLPPPPPLSLVNVFAANFLGKTSAGAAFSGGKNMSDALINGLAGAGGGDHRPAHHLSSPNCEWTRFGCFYAVQSLVIWRCSAEHVFCFFFPWWSVRWIRGSRRSVIWRKRRGKSAPLSKCVGFVARSPAFPFSSEPLTMTSAPMLIWTREFEKLACSLIQLLQSGDVQVVKHEEWERLYGGLMPSLVGTAASQVSCQTILSLWSSIVCRLTLLSVSKSIDAVSVDGGYRLSQN